MTPLIALQLIAALGDSVTKGVRTDGSVTPEQTFAAVIGQRTGRPVLNAGAGGNNTAQMLDRLDRDVLAHKPVTVLIMAGLNDAAMIDGGPVARTWPRISVEAYGRNLGGMVQRVRASGATPVVMTPNPMTRRYPYANLGAYLGRDINDPLVSYAAEARDVARATSACLVDVYAAWIARRDLESLLPDGIHPNPEGHRLIADQVIAACLSRR